MAKGASDKMDILSESFDAFLIGGKALFTVKNTKTDKRFTYRIRQCKDKETLFFVTVLVGPDNYTNYKFFGIITTERGDIQYFYSRKSAKISEDAPSVAGFKQFIEQRKNLPSHVEVWSAGKCSRCNYRLTSEWAKVGIGPECYKKMGF